MSRFMPAYPQIGANLQLLPCSQCRVWRLGKPAKDQCPCNWGLSMSRRCSSLLPVLLFLAHAHCALADGDPSPRGVVDISAKELDQIVYKGLVGNVLDGIPMDPSKRVSLQRTNAVISNTLSGRSLAVLSGLSNPVLLIGGFVWGVWAASNIKPEENGMKAIFDASQSGRKTAMQEHLVTRLDDSSAAKGALAKRRPETATAKSISAAASDQPSRVRQPVVKVWLPQRPSMMAVAQ